MSDDKSRLSKAQNDVTTSKPQQTSSGGTSLLPSIAVARAEPPASAVAAPSKRLRLDAWAALARAAFEASVPLPLRREMLQSEGSAIVVRVPSATWVKPISDYIDQMMPSSRYSRTGSEKQRDNPAEGNEAVATSLAAGDKVVGVSQDPKKFLPRLLVQSADIRIDIKAPDAAAIGRAMRWCLPGRVPADLPPDLGAGMDVAEIVAALRKHTLPAEAMRRMQSFSADRAGENNGGDNLPQLEDALFYGEARTWGLAFAKDVADAKAGIIKWDAVDRGAVFSGGAGTGKTMLATLIARCCGIPIVCASIPELFAASTGYLDGVIKAQRALFGKAAAMAPAILFLDELDGLPNRALLDSRNRDFWNSVIGDTLISISAAPKNLFFLGATNHPHLLDPALVRTARMERVIEILPPRTAPELVCVLRFHLAGALRDEDLIPVARLGLGATPATAMGWVRAARRSARTAGRELALSDLAEAVCPPDTRTRRELLVTGLHEAAHAVAAIRLGVAALHSVSIVAKGESAGRASLNGLADLVIQGRDQIEALVVILLAGRSAEAVLIGSPTGGAGGHSNSDLALATTFVTSIHASLGLGGSAVYRGSIDEVCAQLAFDGDLRKTVDRHLATLAARAEMFVRTHRADILAVAEQLVRRLYLSVDDVRAVLSRRPRTLRQPAVPTVGAVPGKARPRRLSSGNCTDRAGVATKRRAK